MNATFSFSGFLGHLFSQQLLQGAWTTVWLTVAAMAGGIVLGMLVALMRMSGIQALSLPARGFIWFFRGTPLLIQLVVIYTGLPQLGFRFSVTTCALMGLILHEAAYLSEIIRSGITSVPAGQRESCVALGLTRWQAFSRVIMPQAFRIIIPPLGNSVNGMLKATSITSVIAMEELMRVSEMRMQVNFDVLEVYAAATIYYLALTTLWDLYQRRLEARFGRGYGRMANTKIATA